MPSRKFTVADGMVLVAATAVGLGLLRAHQAAYQELWIYRSPTRIDHPWMNCFPDRQQAEGAIPFLAAWSVAVLVLQLGKPRLRPRRLVHRRGFAACLAATVGVAFWLAMHARPLVASAFHGDSVDFFLAISLGHDMPRLVGAAIGAAWLSLAIGGRWRLRELDWRGRLGRLLGWAWLVAFALLDFNLGLIRS